MLGASRPADAEALASAARHVIGLQPDVRAPGARPASSGSCITGVVTRGAGSGISAQLLELTAGEVVTYFDSPLGFRHGPKSVLDGDTMVVVYVSTDPTPAGTASTSSPRSVRNSDRMRDRDKHRTDPGRAGARHCAAPGLGTTERCPDCVALPGVRQYLALFTSLEHAKTPDNPFRPVKSAAWSRRDHLSAGHRRPVVGAVSAMARYLGVDGGGSKPAFALIDGAGRLLARSAAPTRTTSATTDVMVCAGPRCYRHLRAGRHHTRRHRLGVLPDARLWQRRARISNVWTPCPDTRP